MEGDAFLLASVFHLTHHLKYLKKKFNLCDLKYKQYNKAYFEKTHSSPATFHHSSICTHSHTLTQIHTLTPSHTQSHTHSHTLAHTHTDTHTHTITYTVTYTLIQGGGGGRPLFGRFFRVSLDNAYKCWLYIVLLFAYLKRSIT